MTSANPNCSLDLPFRGRRFLASGCVAVLVAGIAALAPCSASAQVVNPATQSSQPQATAGAPATQATQFPVHTWDMPPIDVTEKASISEEDLIGSNRQPRWTAHRRFGETRVYVVPAGMAEFEFWLVPERSRGGETETASMYEMEFGLPGRLQLDFYAVAHKQGSGGPMSFDEQKYEVRWAFADWNRIPGNPTVYLEWKSLNSAPDHVEAKLLLGGQIASRWHWGSNFVFEHEMGGAQENSREWTTGVSYTLADTKASLGVETQIALVDSKNAAGIRGDTTTEFLIGPSLQLRPLKQMHLDFAPLFGVNDNSPRVKFFMVMGWEF